MSATAIVIRHREQKAFVAATLLEGLVPGDLTVVENSWSGERSLVLEELLRAGVPRTECPQSLHWDWSRKAPHLQLLEYSGFGIVCDHQWQGLMLTKTAGQGCRLDAARGKDLVYIDFLEIAPWNWVIPQIGRAGRYQSVGSRLFHRAVRQSQEEGFHGRVGLHSLPQAEAFYRRCGMTPVGRDSYKQDLLYLELSQERAEALLESGGKS